MLLIPIMALGTHCKSLSATQFNPLIEPGLQKTISQDGEIIISHLHFFFGTIQSLQQQKKLRRERLMHYSAVA